MIKILPAIDLIDGKCVRLTQGSYNSKIIYNQDPLDQAKQFATAGAKYLHLVDLDGARAGEPKNLAVLRDICTATNLAVDFSGGVRTEDHLTAAFSAGAQQVPVGSLAVNSPEQFKHWLIKFGSDRIVLSADVRDGLVATSGWETQTKISLIPFVQDFIAAGLKHLICTDISKDGMLQGVAAPLYAQLKSTFPDLVITASGGVGSVSDIKSLSQAGIHRVIIGKALYEGRINLSELADYLC